MEKKNFWNEAAKYGVIMALVAILFDVLGFYVQNTLLSLLSLVIFVLLWGISPNAARNASEPGDTATGSAWVSWSA